MTAAMAVVIIKVELLIIQRQSISRESSREGEEVVEKYTSTNT